MPWFNLNQWTEEDSRAFYRYVRQPGPVGKAVTVAAPRQSPGAALYPVAGAAQEVKRDG